MTAVVQDRRPPMALVRVLNAIMRVLLRTPLARLARPIALLEFEGRRSGRRYRIPVGWHHVAGEPVVFTPAPWRANFSDERPVTVRHRGTTTAYRGRLVTDPIDVATALRAALTEGSSPAQIGLKIPADHEITADDVVALDRALIRFT